jgi:serine protease DegQ
MTGGLPSSTLRSFSDGQMKDGTKGVVIDNVDKGSAAAQVGLHKDDRDNQRSSR